LAIVSAITPLAQLASGVVPGAHMKPERPRTA
jgi:hypothetical protein